MQALDRLAKLRAAMENLGIDAVIIPTADPHLSEYVPAHWSLRAALSGFTGSAGMLLVSAEDAALIADSRYWEQAEKQLPAEIALIRLTGSFLDHVTAWCEETLPQGSIVGYDPELVSLNLAEKLRSLLEDLGFEADALAGERSLPLADIWPDRPPLSMSPIRLMKRPGRSIVEKLEAVRSMMADKGAQSVFFSALDDVAWMTNLRGSDVPCNPVFLAYLLVERDSAELFVDAERLSAEAARAIADAGIATVSPSTLHEALAAAACKLLDKYKVDYCVESFDPRCLMWLWQNRTDVVRGQLSENFARHGDGKDLPGAVRWVLSNLLLNCRTRPAFIAYRFEDRDSLSLKLCRSLYGAQEFSWTIRNREDMAAAEEAGALVIFERFDPREGNK